MHTCTKSTDVTLEMRKDVLWFLSFVKQFNGTSTYAHVPLKDYEIVELNASLKGLFSFDLNMVIIPSTFSIVHLEMLNVLVACRVFRNVWRKRLIHV